MTTYLEMSQCSSIIMPLWVHVDSDNKTKGSVTSSGDFNVSGSSPGIADSRIVVRVFPGFKRFARISVPATSSA